MLVHHGAGIQHIDEGPHMRDGRGFREGNDDTDDGLLAEGHKHAHARPCNGDERVGDQIGECLVDTGGDGDVGEVRHGAISPETGRSASTPCPYQHQASRRTVDGEKAGRQTAMYSAPPAAGEL